MRMFLQLLMLATAATGLEVTLYPEGIVRISEHESVNLTCEVRYEAGAEDVETYFILNGTVTPTSNHDANNSIAIEYNGHCFTEVAAQVCDTFTATIMGEISLNGSVISCYSVDLRAYYAVTRSSENTVILVVLGMPTSTPHPSTPGITLGTVLGVTAGSLMVVGCILTMACCCCLSYCMKMSYCYYPGVQEREKWYVTESPEDNPVYITTSTTTDHTHLSAKALSNSHYCLPPLIQLEGPENLESISNILDRGSHTNKQEQRTTELSSLANENEVLFPFRQECESRRNEIQSSGAQDQDQLACSINETYTFCTIPDCACQNERRQYYNELVTSFQRSQNRVTTSHSEQTLFTVEYPSGSNLYDSLPVSQPLAVYTYDSSGGDYYNPDHEFGFRIPKGAIMEGLSIHIAISVSLTTPIVFPQNMKPVSATIGLCIQQIPQFEFLIPVEVTLPHFLDLTDDDSTAASRELCFLKANHRVNQEQQYIFKAADGRPFFPSSELYGKLSIHHFCYLCIAETTRECTAKASYCLISVIRKSPSWAIHFCVAYFLPSCIKAVENQYPHSEGYELQVKKFKFADKSADAQIKIYFERKMPDKWLLALQTDDKISVSAIDFWDKDEDELKMMDTYKMYPPRFSIAVSGGASATVTACARIHFKGSVENLDIEVPLEPLSSGLDPRFRTYSLPVIGNATDDFGPLIPARPGPYYPMSMAISQLKDSWGDYPLPEGYPSDQELQEVSKEVMGKLGDDWTKLQQYLNIPDHVIAEINSPGTTLNQKVFRTLQEWRKHSRDGSKVKLAQCLRAADPRLSKAANKLCSNEYILISPTSSSVSSRSSLALSGPATPSGSLKRSYASDPDSLPPPVKSARLKDTSSNYTTETMV